MNTPYYAKVGVSSLWRVDREARTVTEYGVDQDHWIDLGTGDDDADARIRAFDAVPFDVRSLWA